MYQHSYAEILADAATEARTTERQTLDRAIAKLRLAANTEWGSPQECDAIEFLTQLWAAFIKDLANPGNDLPTETRASLMRTGLGILSEAQRIQLGLSRDFEALIEICGIVRDGLI